MDETSRRPCVAVTMGDPAGIGPEIVAKAVADPEVMRVSRPLVVGDLGVMAHTVRALGLGLRVQAVPSPGAGRYEPGWMDVLDLGNVDLGSLRMGEVQPAAGRAAAQAVERAVRLALAGEVQAITTAPLHKEALWAAGYPYPGHTEMLAALAGSSESLTMFVIGSLRIFFLTRHLALRELGFPSPRIAVAALNPHAGEGGKMGDEEIREIGPGIEEARASGLQVTGPVPADSVFHLAREGRFDAVLSLYHDQGHIAAKMVDFYRTVSVTTGLPFVRTSVDHGTAFDIAGKGVASAVSMVEAIRVAADLTLKRQPVRLDA